MVEHFHRLCVHDGNLVLVDQIDEHPSLPIGHKEFRLSSEVDRGPGAAGRGVVVWGNRDQDPCVSTHKENLVARGVENYPVGIGFDLNRSEEHTSELQSPM